MTVEFVDVGNNLLHSGMSFTYAGTLVHNAVLDALDVSGNLVNFRSGYRHVAGKIAANA